MSDQKNKMSKEEEIGYHKGALETLTKERDELARILQVVQHYMQFHLNALKEAGVDIEQKQEQKEESKPKPKKRPIEDIL